MLMFSDFIHWCDAPRSDKFSLGITKLQMEQHIHPIHPLAKDLFTFQMAKAATTVPTLNSIK